MTQNTPAVNADELNSLIRKHLRQTLVRNAENATSDDWWNATCYAVRDIIFDRFMETQSNMAEQKARRVYYLSLEYLMGRLLSNNLHNLGLFDLARDALKLENIEIDELLEEENDMALGNGGLGRLAACFLDSLATMDLPAIGYGIEYQFGLFKQSFENGNQMEGPDNWREFGSPWQIVRSNRSYDVPLYGSVEHRDGKACWVNTKIIKGIPYDIPIVGYGGNTINFLRLWESRASAEFDFEAFNKGGYFDAVEAKMLSETISKVLYPNDETDQGKKLRLIQQYFFVNCSLQDIIKRHKKHGGTWENLPEKVAVQLNDTHPAVAVPELMRLLIDEAGMEWMDAWSITRKVFSYTNHTILPEALERWPVRLFERILPRHLEIIYEINNWFLDREVDARWPADMEMRSKLSLIEEGGEKMVRMANLSIVGSHKVNGVAALHTQLLKDSLFKDFHELYPDKLVNMTNGITPRRWLKACNPELSALIDEKIGEGWVTDLSQLKGLEAYVDDAEFRQRFFDIKHANKEKLAEEIETLCGVTVDPFAIFDCQVKRLHEYKRQQLNLLHILALYRRLLRNPDLDVHPRVFIFGAKAAPGYHLAKNIIYAINKVGDRINNDPRIGGKLKVAFLPNYRVTLAERIIPAADLSEQISLAGLEASGTGNMKFALNGALTIGTLDGANVEIDEEVGRDNIFIFGMEVDKVAEARNGYRALDYYENDEEIRAIIDWMKSDYFTPGKTDSFAPLVEALIGSGNDYYMALADFRSYSDAQLEVDKRYRDQDAWVKSAILNTARVGKFSSDRTIQDYADVIWDIKPIRT